MCRGFLVLCSLLLLSGTLQRGWCMFWVQRHYNLCLLLSPHFTAARVNSETGMTLKYCPVPGTMHSDPRNCAFPMEMKACSLILPAPNVYNNRQHTWGLPRRLSLVGNFTSWPLPPCDYADPETQTYKWASQAWQRQGQPGNNAKKSHNSSWQMNNSLLEATTWRTMRALAFSAHWHWRLQGEIDIITRHNQNDKIMQHLQLIFTFRSLERLFCHNSLVSKKNLARQLLWFSSQSGHVKKVRKLL